MEDKFYNDEFEQFLQQQANNHRMYPTDGVWLGIYKKLHGHRKWPALTISAFTILIATIATSLYFSPKPNIFALTENEKAVIQQHTKQGVKSPLVNLSMVDKQVVGSNLVSQTQPLTTATMQRVVFPQAISEELEPSIVDQNDNGDDLIVVEKAEKKYNSNIKTQELQTVNIPGASISLPEANNDLQFVEELTNKAVAGPITGVEVSKAENDPNDKNIADRFLQEHSNDVPLYTNSKLISKKKRFSYTVYVAPSASYRRLKENEDLNRKSTNISGPVAANFVTDVNKLVRHKPGTGLEAGVAFTYHLTNTLGIKTGLQFNVRQYNIEAYRSSTELASIALLSNSGIDTINTYAFYRNSNGNASAELINRYYQVAIPVGIEWEVIGSKKVKFNIAANIQPTYNLNRNSYILSTNFKNYTNNSGMLRNWNINSSVEAFMSVKLGDYRWQLGPQFRYQNLSTFIAEYPIRENLVDYGFKIGVSKVIK